MPIYDGATLLTGGGGGGLLKQTKYSTARSLGDTDRKLLGAFTAQGLSGQPIGTTEMVINTFIPADFADGLLEDVLVGTTFVSGTETSTILSSTATIGTGGAAAITITFAARTETIAILIPFTPPTTFMVNPATDLSLSDGDLLGYFMVGAGNTGQDNVQTTSTSFGGAGGRILQGTIPIVTAATDLSLTIGTGVSGEFQTGGNSTITGGLTLTTGDGSQIAGHRGTGFGSQNLGIGASAAGIGINGYGAGDGASLTTATSDSGIAAADKHGFGMGAFQEGQSGDGAIIFFY